VPRLFLVARSTWLQFCECEEKTHDEKPPEAGLSLVCACLNQLVNRRGDARNPLGSNASLHILDAGKIVAHFGAGADARMLTMRGRALTKDAYLRSV
jgi:hypothetical protein